MNGMYYRINKWNKVESGVYESNQKTFNWNTRKYCGLYRIEKAEVKAARITCTVWTLYKFDDESNKVFMKHFNTLKDAKAFAENDFGVTFKLDEIDIAG
jgi:hypothetical protein